MHAVRAVVVSRCTLCAHSSSIVGTVDQVFEGDMSVVDDYDLLLVACCLLLQRAQLQVERESSLKLQQRISYVPLCTV